MTRREWAVTGKCQLSLFCIGLHDLSFPRSFPTSAATLLYFQFFSVVSLLSCRLLIPMQSTVGSRKQFLQGWLCVRPLPSEVPKPISLAVMYNLSSRAVTDCSSSPWQTSIRLRLTLGEQKRLTQLPPSAVFTNPYKYNLFFK